MLSHYLRQSLLLAILSLAPLTVAPAVAQSPQGWVQAGVLSCRLNPSIGFVIFVPPLLYPLLSPLVMKA